MQQQFTGQTPTFSLYDVLRGMGGRKLLMLACLAIGVVSGLGIVTLVKPIYRAEARVLIDNQATPYDQTNSVQQANSDGPVDNRVISSQVAVMQSEDMGDRVIEALKLTENPEFNSLLKGVGVLQRVLIGLGFSDDPRPMTPDQRAFRRLSSQLVVYPFEDANVIGIKYSAGDGETAANVANKMAEIYVQSTQESKLGANARAREWLSQQIEVLRKSVAESDAAVEKYRAEAGLLKGEKTTLGAQEISELNTQITLAEAARSEADARARQIRDMLKDTGSVDSATDVLSSPTIQRLRESQVAANRRVSELSATYLPNHPKMIAAQKDVASIDAQIRREALKIVEGLQGQAQIAATRADSLRKSLEQMKGREGGALMDEVKLAALERDAKANRDLLENMLARYADSNARQNSELLPGNARIIQYASPPTSYYFPKMGPIIMLTSLAGLGLGLGLAFLFEIMAQATRLNDIAAEQIVTAGRVSAVRVAAEQQFPIPGLGFGDAAKAAPPPPAGAAAPFAAAGPGASPFAPPPAMSSDLPQQGAVDPAASMLAAAHIAAAMNGQTKFQAPGGSAAMPDQLATASAVPAARSALEAQALLTSLAEGGAEKQALDRLISNMLQLRQQKRIQAWGVTGISGAYEVPAATVALGRRLASAGLKTILVDVEAVRPLVTDLMGLPHAPGLADLLAGRSDFTKIIQRDPASALQVVRFGTPDPAISADVLAARMEAITATLCNIYDIVLLHAGEASPATLGVVRGCKGVVLFAQDTRQRDALAASSTLHGRGIENVEIIRVNDTSRAVA